MRCRLSVPHGRRTDDGPSRREVCGAVEWVSVEGMRTSNNANEKKAIVKRKEVKSGFCIFFFIISPSIAQPANDNNKNISKWREPTTLVVNLNRELSEWMKSKKVKRKRNLLLIGKMRWFSSVCCCCSLHWLCWFSHHLSLLHWISSSLYLLNISSELRSFFSSVWYLWRMWRMKEKESNRRQKLVFLRSK